MNEYKRVCVNIKKDALLTNIQNIRKCKAEDAKLAAVIKADAYGHGADLVSKVIEPMCDYFAVATVEEALELKRSGVKIPLLLLGYTHSDYYEDVLKFDLRIPIFKTEDAKKLSETALKMNKTANIHIALDTGMGRIGFLCSDEALEAVREISNLPMINIEGMFSHFAAADEYDDSFSLVQAKKYTDFACKLEKSGVNIPIKHISNSAAVMMRSEYHFNMVRSGIITYGLYPSQEVDKKRLHIEPVMEMVSHAVFIKEINKGDTVSYGRTFTADKKMKIATVPVGYADGYPRLLSNKGRVIIRGSYAPIVGRVCMDQFMVDVTDIPNVEENDIVTLIGKQGDAEITAEEIALHAQTINYEIVTCIGKRVPRNLV